MARRARLHPPAGASTSTGHARARWAKTQRRAAPFDPATLWRLTRILRAPVGTPAAGDAFLNTAAGAAPRRAEHARGCTSRPHVDGRWRRRRPVGQGTIAGNIGQGGIAGSIGHQQTTIRWRGDQIRGPIAPVPRPAGWSIHGRGVRRSRTVTAPVVSNCIGDPNAAVGSRAIAARGADGLGAPGAEPGHEHQEKGGETALREVPTDAYSAMCHVGEFTTVIRTRTATMNASGPRRVPL